MPLSRSGSGQYKSQPPTVDSRGRDKLQKSLGQEEWANTVRGGEQGWRKRSFSSPWSMKANREQLGKHKTGLGVRMELG